jgi:hypothetical protein
MSGLSDSLHALAEEIHAIADLVEIADLERPGVIVSASGLSSDPGSLRAGTSAESSSMVTLAEVPLTRANGETL